MLSRYTIYRGKAAKDHPAPTGVRQDTRKHTRHVLRPSDELVAAFLSSPDDESWQVFAAGYLALLESRYAGDSQAFNDLAATAGRDDVYLGCNCPTRNQPTVEHCHTWLALEFMQATYPDLTVVFPESAKRR